MSESGSRPPSSRPSRTSSRQGHYDPRPSQTGHSSGQYVPASQRFDYATPPSGFPASLSPAPRVSVPTSTTRARGTPTVSKPASDEENPSDQEPPSPTKEELLVEYNKLDRQIQRYRRENIQLRLDQTANRQRIDELTKELEEAKVVASLIAESPTTTSRDKGKGRATSLSPVRKPRTLTPPPSRSPSPQGDPIDPPPDPPRKPAPDPDPEYPSDSDDEDDMADKKLASAFAKLEEKLKANGSNWTVWSGRVRNIATMNQAASILEADLPATADDKVKEIDALFLGFMLLSINDVTWQKHDKNVKTSYQLWTALQNEFAKSNPVTCAQLKARFYTCHCLKGNIRGWITELEARKRKIIEDGDSISDVTMVEQLLAGAPAEYLGMLISLTAGKTAKDFTPAEIIDALHVQYDMRNAQHHPPKTEKSQPSTSKPKETAAPAKSSSRQGNRRARGKGKGKPDPKPKAYDKPSATCFKCGGKGHTANICPSPARQSAHAAEDDDSDESEEANVASGVYDELMEELWFAQTRPTIYDCSDLADSFEQQCAFMVSTTRCPPREPIDLFDSGASSHMTWDFNALSNFEEIEPVPICIVNQGTLYATGRGDYFIKLPVGNKVNQLRLHNVRFISNLGKTLVSLSKLAEAGFETIVKSTCLHIRTPKNELIGVVPARHGAYSIPCIVHASPALT